MYKITHKVVLFQCGNARQHLHFVIRTNCDNSIRIKHPSYLSNNETSNQKMFAPFLHSTSQLIKLSEIQ